MMTDLPEPKTPGYSNEEYEEQKERGERLPNGARPLKQLNQQHWQVVFMLAQGAKNKEIKRVLGFTDSYISILKQDPLVKQEVQKLIESEKDRVEAMFGEAVDVVQDSLNPDIASLKERLKGVDRYVKLYETVQKERGQGRSAEDLVNAIINNNGTMNVQINQGSGSNDESQ